MLLRIVLMTALVAVVSPAQTVVRKPFIRASGEGVVSFQPDQMKLAVSVVTQADTAQQAADDNATRSTAVIDAVKRLLGAKGDLRTTSYSVNPVYKYSTNGISTLVGYSATNSLEVTTTDLGIAGRLIDVGVQSGATTVGGIRFGLKDPQPARQTALKLATQQARSSAEAIASGLNARLGAVVSVEESSAVGSVTSNRVDTAAGGGAATPVETGMVEVRASVIIEVELI